MVFSVILSESDMRGNNIMKNNYGNIIIWSSQECAGRLLGLGLDSVINLYPIRPLQLWLWLLRWLTLNVCLLRKFVSAVSRDLFKQGQVVHLELKPNICIETGVFNNCLHARYLVFICLCESRPSDWLTTVMGAEIWSVGVGNLWQTSCQVAVGEICEFFFNGVSIFSKLRF